MPLTVYPLYSGVLKKGRQIGFRVVNFDGNEVCRVLNAEAGGTKEASDLAAWITSALNDRAEIDRRIARAAKQFEERRDAGNLG